MIKYNCTTINRNPEICIILESWPCNFPIFSLLPPDPSEHFPPSLFGFRLTSAVVVSACRKASQWQQVLALLENMEVAVPHSTSRHEIPVEGKVVSIPLILRRVYRLYIPGGFLAGFSEASNSMMSIFV